MTVARTLVLVAAALSVSAMLAPPSNAQSRSERDRLNEMEAACYKAREEKIRVVQAQKIDACVAAPAQPRAAAKSRADCERHFGDFGWSQGVGLDLPQCKEAFEARQQHRAPTRPSRTVP